LGASYEKLALPPTLKILSGGGGWHFIYRAPREYPFPGQDGGLGRGWDIKHHGYSVLPPRVHPSRGKYRLAKNGADPLAIADCPYGILDRSKVLFRLCGIAHEKKMGEEEARRWAEEVKECREHMDDSGDRERTWKRAWTRGWGGEGGREEREGSAVRGPTLVRGGKHGDGALLNHNTHNCLEGLKRIGVAQELSWSTFSEELFCKKEIVEEGDFVHWADKICEKLSMTVGAKLVQDVCLELGARKKFSEAQQWF